MKLERTATSYAVEIDRDDFLALTRIEGDWPLQRTLAEDLDQLDGIDKVDYNGHFGACIYFTIEVGNDNPKTHKQILDLIEKHVDRAKKAPRKSTGAVAGEGGFFLGPADVVAAASVLGYEIDQEAASTMLKETERTELEAICVAAVEGSDDPEERTFIARGRIADFIARGWMVPPLASNPKQ